MITNNQNVVTKLEKSDLVAGKLKIEGVEVLGAFCCSNLSNLKSLEIRDGVRVIGMNAFENCDELEYISLPESLIMMSSEVFSDCNKLTKILLPSKLTELERNLFEDCINLQFVTLPKKLIKLGEGVFTNCASLKEIQFPDTLQSIGEGAFQSCKNLRKIILPAKLKSLGGHVFSNCKKLEELHMGEGITILNSGTFENCESLKNIKLSKDIQIIYSSAFENCKSLVKIELPNNLITLEYKVFKNCLALKKICLPETLENIGHSIFKDCKSLTEITIPNKITKLDTESFKGCINLKKVKLSDRLEKIEAYAFCDCESLTDINLPFSLTKIGKYAFSGCKNLKQVSIENAEIKKGAFERCQNLKQIRIGQNCKFKDYSPKNLKYLSKDGDYFYLTEKPINSQSFFIENSNLNVCTLMSLWEEREKINFNDIDASIYNALAKILDKNKFLSFFHNHNLKFFRQLINKHNLVSENENVFEVICKIYYNLGGFNLPEKFEEKTKKGLCIREIDYAQKVGEFIKENFGNDKLLNAKIAFRTFNSFNVDGFKKEFTDFLLQKDNLETFLRKGSNYFSVCYNNFEQIQDTNTSDKGSQRQLKPTFEKFDQFVNKKDFTNISEENIELAHIVSSYLYTQQDFNEALKIIEEWKNAGSKKQILTNVPKDPFAKIENIEQSIENSGKSTLIEISDKIFSYDWLDKDSAYNFILGKLCNCCAHLRGAGFGIMRASVVREDVQNLVIRKNGNIVTKATLYVNKKIGYGLLNTVELNEKITSEEKQFVYNKLKLAVKDFAEEYNRENPSMPIKLVNIGMGSNQLEHFIRKKDKKYPSILPSPVYAVYGKDEKQYNGDSDFEQFTIWEKED